jgi:serine/threonine protein kinase
VVVDGRGYPPGTGEVELAPGEHRLEIADGSRTLYDHTVSVVPGAEVEIVLPPGDQSAATATPAAPHRPRGRLRRAGIIAGAVGVVLSVAAVLLLRRRRTPPPMEITPTRRLATPPGGLDGHEFGPYLIIDRLGSGGMATTYRAQRVSDGKEVALKIPHDRCLEDESFRRRFVREGQLGSQLHHPNIVRIIEAGEVRELPYIAMELVRGTTLRALLASAGQLPLERALDVTRQVAEALDYAHSKGVIHRDLKPENLMIQPEGTVLVMDFGIARVAGGPGLTATSVFMGTPSYAAPEAVAKETVDHRMDLFALGIILFEMLEGAPPFAGANPLEQIQKHLQGELPAREGLKRPLPDAVWDMFLRLAARRPDDRFATAEELLIALRSLIRQTEEGTIS